MAKTKNLSNFRVWLLFTVAPVALGTTVDSVYAQRGEGRSFNNGTSGQGESEGRRRGDQGSNLQEGRSNFQQQQQGQQLRQSLQQAQLQQPQFQQGQQNFNPGMPQNSSGGGVRGSDVLQSPSSMISGNRVQRSIVANSQKNTLALPEAFAAGDLNKDGQIALIEWKQWQQGKLQQFTTYDKNNDGFLTPIELLNANPPSGGQQNGGPAQLQNLGNPQAQGQQNALANRGGNRGNNNGVNGNGSGNENGPRQFAPNTRGMASSGGGRGRGGPSGETGGGVTRGGRGRGGRGVGSGDDTGSGNNSPAAQPAAQPVDTQSAAAASRFRMMDSNSDGSISAEELAVSEMLKAQFTKGGVNIEQPMSQEEFVKHFVETSSATR